MTYTDWLEKELNIYKRENKLLNEKIDSLADIYVTVGEKSKEQQEQYEKKNDILKWGYSLEKENKELKSTQQELINDVRKYSCQALDLERENKKLKQQIEGLTSENFNLQNSLYTQQLNEDEADDKISELEKDKQAIKSIWKKSREREEKLKEKLKYEYYVKASLFNNIEEYKEKITKLFSENQKLKQELFDIYKEK